MIILIDNQDSFTYNVYHLIASIYPNVRVFRADQHSYSSLKKLQPKAWVLSPGPKRPQDAPLLFEIIHKEKKTPILGICLGMQAIAQYYGANLVVAKKAVHGKVSLMNHNHQNLMTNLTNPASFARYHSLVIERSSVSKPLQVDAQTKEGDPMAISHCYFPHFGVQFHPESVLSSEGDALIKNFLSIAEMYHIKSTNFKPMQTIAC